jgi:HNH endonuclease
MITAEKLRRLLSYQKSTGHFRWRVRRSNRIRVGDIAGSNHRDGTRKINLEGKTYLLHRLAVLHVTGRMPANDVTRRNGNRRDARWRNLKVA